MKSRASLAGVLLAFFITLIAFALLVGGCAVSGYNKAIRLDEQVKSAWSQVENVLQRRYDLIPNLVQTVKGYASHEKQIFENIAQARTKYFQAGSRREKIEAASGFERALSRLLVLQERYPQLKAQESFNRLMDELAGTENRLAVERKRYNDSVRALNTYCRTFFGRIFCGWAGVEEAEYFEVEKPQVREAPKVRFGEDEHGEDEEP